MKSTDHYSIQWQGFHSNIINSLEDLKSVEDFVDVTLSCEGKTFKGHKVILSAGSSYFRRILKENPCGHPVLILNDIQVDILEALMTYIYHGNVSVPHNKLQEFLRSAEAFKIKGIVDALNPQQSKVKTELKAEPNGNLFQPGGLIHGHEDEERKPLPVPTNNSISNNNHINGDLSLLAIAAATTAADIMTVAAAAAPCMDDSNPSQPATASKRRKTVPRKLGSYMSSSPARSAFSSGEEDMLIETSSEKENTATTNSQQIGTTFKLSDKNRMDAVSSPRCREKSLDTEPDAMEDQFATVNEEETAINLTKPVGPEFLKNSPQPVVHSHSNNTRSLLSAAAMFQQLKHQQQQLIPAAQMSTNSSSKDLCGSTTTTTSITDTTSSGGASAAAAAALLGADHGGAAAFLSAEQGGAAALLGAEQMAALLDSPLWKSRQPRMCLHCNRMFSNKFNLKQHILNMHTVGREMQCEICNKKVKNKWYLRRHHVTHHGAPLKK